MIPNQQPSHTAPYRIAVIGDCPGITESSPFSNWGSAGKLLEGVMSQRGLDRNACFVGNVCQERGDAYKDFATFEWGSAEVQDGIGALCAEVALFRPNLVVLLGNAPLHLAKIGNVAPKKRKTPKGPVYAWPHNVSDWRGSLFWSDTFQCKAMASFHPAQCLRQYDWKPLLDFDLKRAAIEGLTPGLDLPVRNLEINLSCHELVTRLDTIRRDRTFTSVDIEGYVDDMWCVGFATSPASAFVLPFTNAFGGNAWEEDEEVALWIAMAEMLQASDVPKVLQNGLYDRFVNHWSYNVCYRGVIEDTMLKGWEHYCELARSLAFLTSIYTREPYYKFEGKSDSHETRLLYCAKDAAVTYEICEALDKHLDEPAQRHYRFNVDLLAPVEDMQLSGIRYDIEKAVVRRAETLEEIYGHQCELDQIAGLGLPAYDKQTILSTAIKAFGKKQRGKNAKPIDSWETLEAKCYKDGIEPLRRIRELLALPELLPVHKGEINTLLDSCLDSTVKAVKNGDPVYHLNVGSADQVCDYLYNKLKFPVQKKRGTGNETKDYEALLKLAKKTNHPAVWLIMKMTELATRARALSISADRDGRIRTSMDLGWQKTGRISSKKSPTRSGYNLTTTTSENDLKEEDDLLHEGLRDLLVADDNHWMFQCDLKGADGWTVAAECAALGDRTMLDDYKFGLKPASILCLALRGKTRYLDPACPRPEIKEACKEVKSKDWDYYACKKGQHGSCYLEGAKRLSEQIFVDSEGKFSMPVHEIEKLQRAFFVRYRGVPLWHQQSLALLKRKPELVSASGHKRRFFGREDEILGEWLAERPQNNTTYALKLAIHKLWRDPENRENERHIIIGQLPVHDALVGQFPKSRLDWALPKIREYFNNELVISGIPLVIPFEGAYGPSWGELGVKHGGGEI